MIMKSNSQFTILNSQCSSLPKRGGATSCIVYCALFMFLLLSTSASAEKVLVEFKQRQTLQKSNELASNMLRVVNNTTKTLNFTLTLNLPVGWSRIGASNTPYSLEAGDSMFIPVKLVFKGKEEGDISY